MLPRMISKKNCLKSNDVSASHLAANAKILKRATQQIFYLRGKFLWVKSLEVEKHTFMKNEVMA